MTRSLARQTLAALTLAVLTLAATSAIIAQEDCPNCPGGQGQGHGHLGHHGRGANVGFYPNNITNYGYDQQVREFAGPGGCRTCANGQCQYRYYSQPDLFYNYYAWPACSGVGAELYVSPRPIPPHVGHTFITYQPLMPHEFLYTHHRTYHRYYNGGQGLNRTSVHYRASLFGN